MLMVYVMLKKQIYEKNPTYIIKSVKQVDLRLMVPMSSQPG